MKIKTMAVIAASAAMLSPTVTPSIQQSPVFNQGTDSKYVSEQTQRKSAPVPAQNVQRQPQQLPSSIGGIPMIGITNIGIPPKIYGMFHVRRGSHKRTNK